MASKQNIGTANGTGGLLSNVIDYVFDDTTKHGDIAANWNYILGDFVLVIVAGRSVLKSLFFSLVLSNNHTLYPHSDPVRQILANKMYYLIRNPQNLERIREELASTDKRDYTAVQQLQHLNACIYETLRLNPAVPSAGLRVAPRDGLMINDTFLPAGTTIVVPRYSLM